MHQTHFKGKPVPLAGNFPSVHMKAPSFQLVDKELHTKTLAEFQGKRKLLATVPSLDTGTCSLMTKHLNQSAKAHPNYIFLVVSADLPFAQKRFCEAEQVHNLHTLSMMRDKEFGKAYGVLVADGPMAGLLARSILVLDEKDHVLYGELVSEITQEPNYHKALEVLQGHHKG